MSACLWRLAIKSASSSSACVNAWRLCSDTVGGSTGDFACGLTAVSRILCHSVDAQARQSSPTRLINPTNILRSLDVLYHTSFATGHVRQL